MNKLSIGVKDLSDLISTRSRTESNFHPINRLFLNRYLDQILACDPTEFLFYNLENSSNLYSEYLMLSLPELWLEISLEDLVNMMKKFTNSFSFFSILIFSHKHIEINIVDVVLNLKTLDEFRRNEIKMFLQRQFSNMFKDEGDLFFMNEGLIGVNFDEWNYVRQKLLLDKRIKPAFDSAEEFEAYIKTC